MGNAIDGEGMGRVVQDITDSLSRNGHALISHARLKTADAYTYMHSVPCAMTVALARHLDSTMNRRGGRGSGPGCMIWARRCCP